MRATGLPFPIVATALALLGCNVPEQKQAYEFVVHVTSDPGQPVAGALLSYNGSLIGPTKDDGTRRLAIQGAEGEVYSVTVRCPDGYRSPAAPLTLTLRRLSDHSNPPEYAASCRPTMRSVVVSVRADNGRNLPVLHLGREIARTDESGTAHVLLSLPPEETFELKLDTTETGNERLRPQSPTMQFAVRDHDEIFVFDQKFALEAERVSRTVRKHRGPTPITAPTPLH